MRNISDSSQTQFPEYRIDRIPLPNDAFELKDDVPFRLNRLNVLIGPNNSGKSRLLRHLFVEASIKSQRQFFQSTILKDWDRFMIEFKAICADYRHPDIRPDYFPLPSAEALDVVERHMKVISQRGLPAADTLRNAYARIQGVLDQVKRGRNWLEENVDLHSVYIPILRGLRPLNRTGQQASREQDPLRLTWRTLHDHFSARFSHFQVEPKSAREIQDLKIVTGLEFYDLFRMHLLGKRHEREMIKDFEAFLRTRFFEGKPVTFIPIHDSDVLYVQIGDEQERPIYDLGDGIGQIIIMTLPLFLHRSSHLLLFIEEPELNLHPGLQRKLIDAFLMPVDNGATRQVFVSTHSNQFLDITLDHSEVAIFKVQKSFDSGKTKFSVTPKQAPDDFELLWELGVWNSSVLLSNCTIWVEGITDRYYLRAFLEVLQKEKPPEERFDEDKHFSFVTYGGAAITHWAFLDNELEPLDHKRIAGPVFLVADSDNVTETHQKSHRQDKLRQYFKEDCHILAAKEIENLLSPQTLLAVLAEMEDKAADDTDVFDQDFSWDDYKNKKIGVFIDDKVLHQKSTRKSKGNVGYKYADKSGTIKEKKRFCEIACNHIRSLESVDELTPEASELARGIYAFIKKCNRGVT